MFISRTNADVCGDIVGNITTLDQYKYIYGTTPFTIPLANCTTYAYGRVQEIYLMNGYDLSVRTHYDNPYWWSGACTYPNAEDWFEENMVEGVWEYGETPKLGAIACFSGNHLGLGGHVAIVEKINTDDTVDLSDSSYGGWIFSYHQNVSLVVGQITTYVGEEFLGYIYPPITNTFNSNLLIFRRGDYVKIIDIGRAQANGGGRIAYGIGWTRRIIKVYENEPYPYRVGFMTGETTGYYKQNALERIDT